LIEAWWERFISCFACDGFLITHRPRRITWRVARKDEWLFRLALATAAFGIATARACDLCGCYTPQIEAMSQSEMSAAGPMSSSRFFFAVAEQFTHFGTLQLDGKELDNPTGQYLDSSICGGRKDS